MESKENLLQTIKTLQGQINNLSHELDETKKQLNVCESASIASFSPIKSDIFRKQKYQVSSLKKNMFLSLEQIISQNFKDISKDALLALLKENFKKEIPSFFELINMSSFEDISSLLDTEQIKSNLKHWVSILSYLIVISE